MLVPIEKNLSGAFRGQRNLKEGLLSLELS